MPPLPLPDYRWVIRLEKCAHTCHAACASACGSAVSRFWNRVASLPWEGSKLGINRWCKIVSVLTLMYAYLCYACNSSVTHALFCTLAFNEPLLWIRHEAAANEPRLWIRHESERHDGSAIHRITTSGFAFILQTRDGWDWKGISPPCSVSSKRN